MCLLIIGLQENCECLLKGELRADKRMPALLGKTGDSSNLNRRKMMMVGIENHDTQSLSLSVINTAMPFLA